MILTDSHQPSLTKMNSFNYVLIVLCLLSLTRMTQSSKIIQLAAGQTKCRLLPPDTNLHLSIQVLNGEQADIYFKDGDQQVGHLNSSVYEEDFYLPPEAYEISICLHNSSNQTSIEVERTITASALNKMVLNFGLIGSALLLVLLALLSCCVYAYLIYRKCSRGQIMDPYLAYLAGLPAETEDV